MDSLKSPKFSHDYVDPYDTIPGSADRAVPDPVYRDPINCVFTDHSKMELKKLNDNKEGDARDVGESGKTRKLAAEDIECLYAKPMKKVKKEQTEVNHVAVSEGGLYAEIMEHLNTKQEPLPPRLYRKPNRDYATIDEIMLSPVIESPPVANESMPYKDTKVQPETQPAKFAKITRSKKLTVMAASTEKIYETYLSYGKKTELDRYKKELKSCASLKPLSQRCQSQPDVFSGTGLKVFDVDIDKEPESKSNSIAFSSFKPAEMTVKNNGSVPNIKSSVDNFREGEFPGTPVIMATASFDSLCSESQSHSSGSPQSLQNKSISISAESLSSKSNHSAMTTSSLSLSPDHGTNFVPVLPPKKQLTTFENTGNKMLLDTNQRNHTQNAGAVEQIPPIPVKRTTLKNGIDLSVYLLKPQNEVAKLEVRANVEDKTINKPAMSTFKDTLSGVKTNLTPGPKTAPQVNHNFRHDMNPKVTDLPEHKPPLPSKPSHTPSIGIAAKARAINRQKEGVIVKSEPGNKREFDELMKADNHYLETDLDSVSVTSETENQPMKKSRSLGRFEPAASTVVTEIW